jgi:hypothetical protein
VFTDGYVEYEFNWVTNIPPIWIIKEGGKDSFVPPRGVKVVMQS